MTDVSVKDVSEIHNFASGINNFSDEYSRLLMNMYSATNEDRTNVDKAIDALKQTVANTQHLLDEANERLNKYYELCYNTRDKDGNPKKPDSEVIEKYKRAIQDAEEKLTLAKRNLKEGEEIASRTRKVIDEIESFASSSFSCIRNMCNEAVQKIHEASNKIIHYSTN